MSPGKIVFGVDVPRKTSFRCGCPQEKVFRCGCPHEKTFSAWMSPGKIVFGVVPSKNVVHPHYTTVYCDCFSVVLVAFRFGETQPDGYLVGKELVILLFVCVVGKVFCCVLCVFFPAWCLCWGFKSNCIDSWSLYFHFPSPPYVLRRYLDGIQFPLGLELLPKLEAV